MRAVEAVEITMHDWEILTELHHLLHISLQSVWRRSPQPAAVQGEHHCRTSTACANLSEAAVHDSQRAVALVVPAMVKRLHSPVHIVTRGYAVIHIILNGSQMPRSLVQVGITCIQSAGSRNKDVASSRKRWEVFFTSLHTTTTLNQRFSTHMGHSDSPERDPRRFHQ